VVQAYGPRAPYVIDWLYTLAGRYDRRIMVRLVKGAYWDSEIKRAQTLGLTGYPVFTRKANTDVSYIACAKKLLSMTDRIYPQFATHNAHTVAAILEMADDKKAFEFQRLHGMGDALHETVRASEGTRCRVYAPVGAHTDLLAYLVRRLLENGANSSFVHQIVDEEVSAETIARDPFETVATQGPAENPHIAAPAAIFGAGRRNSSGCDITDPVVLAGVTQARAAFGGAGRWTARASVGALKQGRDIVNPARPDDVVGTVFEAGLGAAAKAVTLAAKAQPGWAATPVGERAEILARAADLYEKNAVEFFALCTREAGKTLADGVAEVREAVDFLRYYATEAAKAEQGTAARGVIACISPWNFPLAIFTGQVAAALATGNTVVAKPAEQTPLIAARAVDLLHRAGVPAGALHLLPGDGPSVGAPLTADKRIAGVCFTGSTEVARLIERQLAETAAPDAMLIAETGGLNAMIVDSTALPEQAVRDVLASAFQSAGQRCSALRVLYVQDDVAPKLLHMLEGAVKELKVGDPWDIASDVGPVIDREAFDQISAYADMRRTSGQEIARVAAPETGLFVAPQIVRINGIADVEREIFGPVLHVATYGPEAIDKVIGDINGRGYGLTFGLHTRIDARVQHVIDRIHAGNIYINRNQIGAVVGSQPFGGEGLSGTGPKAGGPHYLRRFRKSAVASGAAAQGIAASMPKTFPDAQGWARRSDRVETLRKLLRGKAADAIAAAAALDYGSVDLPGPTGEANTLALSPRGRVLCLGPDADSLLAQAVQALAAGNSVIAVALGANAALQPLLKANLPIEAVDGTLLPSELASTGVDVVAYARAGETARQIRQVLAARSGPIVPIVSETIYPAAYAHERTVCVDTTAAGGNASLLAAS